MKADPIIAVKDVNSASEWYKTVFGLTSKHGGSEFDILVDKNGDVILCLHKWEAHGHPSMQEPNKFIGNGVILYFRVKTLKEVRNKLRQLDYKVESEIELSPNSLRREFSFRDPNGYYIIVAEYHEYQG